MLLHERPRFANPDLESKPDSEVVVPALPALPPLLPAGAVGLASVRVTGAWTAAFRVTSQAAHLTCGTQAYTDGQGSSHRYYAGTPRGFGAQPTEFGLGRGSLGLLLSRRHHYTVEYDRDRVRLDSESFEVGLFWGTDDKDASIFSLHTIKQRYRVSEDRRRVAFAVAGFVGPETSYDRHEEIGPVEVVGTVSCPQPVAPVAQTAPLTTN